MNEKMEARTVTMQKNGIETGKYFSVAFPQGMKPGDKLVFEMDENGNPVLKCEDPVIEEIFANGYVKNTKLHRRFVMAQMFHMLNYEGSFGSGYTDALKLYPYDYQFKMMIEELHVLDELNKSDDATYTERAHFFTKGVVLATMRDHYMKAQAKVAGLEKHKCKGVPYVKVPGYGNVFVCELDQKVWNPMERYIDAVEKTTDVHWMWYFLKKFSKILVKLPSSTEKNALWVDAFKGAGAYYTAKNLIMFHNCCVYKNHSGWFYNRGPVASSKMTREESLAYLEKRVGDQGWELLGFLKELIADNKFDFGKRMKELGVQDNIPWKFCY